MSANIDGDDREPNPKPEKAVIEKIHVVIVDDHPLCRQGFRQALEEDPRLKCAGEAGDGAAGLALILRQTPHVAVMDINPPAVDALEIAAILKAKKCPTRLAILTAVDDERMLNRALNLGVTGYVLKTSGPGEILNCVAAVAAGQAYVSPALTDMLLRRRSQIEFLEMRQPGLDGLTAAERRILRYIAQGKTSRAIAGELSISRRTVESHRTSISTKLQLKGPHSLLQFAVEHRDALNHLT
jgi:DNA-binding NarL/FixJ family response regulator